MSKTSLAPILLYLARHHSDAAVTFNFGPDQRNGLDGKTSMLSTIMHSLNYTIIQLP